LFACLPLPPASPLFPYTTLFRSDLGLEAKLDAEFPRPLLQDVQEALARDAGEAVAAGAHDVALEVDVDVVPVLEGVLNRGGALRSEEHTSELQSRENLVCRLLLE